MHSCVSHCVLCMTCDSLQTTKDKLTSETEKMNEEVKWYDDFLQIHVDYWCEKFCVQFEEYRIGPS